MVSTTVVLSACCVVAAASAIDCAGGSCQSESATMLQTKKRHDKLSHSQHRKTVEDLHKSTLKLLIEGATLEVVTWAETMTDEIANTVEPAITHSHSVDQTLITNTVSVFQTIKQTYSDDVSELELLQHAHAQNSTRHINCRLTERQDCDAHTACLVEQERLETLKNTAHSEFQNAVNAVKHCDADSTEPMHEQEQHHTAYVTKGDQFFKAWEDYETKRSECNGLKDVLDDRHSTCNDFKTDFEIAACISHDHYTTTYDNMVVQWNSQLGQYDTVKNTTGEDALDRQTEWATLAEIKCLLAKVRDRGGKPCDDAEEPGVAEQVVAECNNTARHTGHLELHYPALPVQPTKPVEKPFPCTHAFVQEHYSSLRGHCFDDLPACKACDGGSVLHHARVSFHDVCIEAKDDKWANIHLKEDTCVSRVHFEHKEGQFSCNSGTPDSNWGCSHDDLSGLVISDGNQVTAPVFDTVNGLAPYYDWNHAHWYKLNGVSKDSESMEWVFNQPLTFKANHYKLWYNEDFTGASTDHFEADNYGRACYDITFEKDPTCNAMAPLQFHDVCVEAKSEMHATITLPADTCVTEISLYWVKEEIKCHGSGGSHFGCDHKIGLVWTKGGEREVILPKEGQVQGFQPEQDEQERSRHWYTMAGMNVGGFDSADRILSMKLNEGLPPLKLSGDLNLWYGEDLANDTEDDNDGRACYEVAVHRTLTC